jgi:hypothetical protein
LYILVGDVLRKSYRIDNEQLPIIVTGREEYYPFFCKTGLGVQMMAIEIGTILPGARDTGNRLC